MSMTRSCAKSRRTEGHTSPFRGISGRFSAGGRIRVHADFDGVPYDGNVVNMGVKNPDGSVCYIIGVTKAVRRALGKQDGDMIHVVIKPLE